MTGLVVEKAQDTQPLLLSTKYPHPPKNLADYDRLDHSYPWIKLIGAIGFDTKHQKFVLVEFQIPNSNFDACNTLSDREQQVLQLVAQGCSNVQIARQLTITKNTVKTHLQNIFAKLKVQSRTEAAFFAAKQGWVTW